MYRGYVKLWRKIDENPIAIKPAYLSVWLYVLRFANHKDKQIIWNNTKTMIKRGSFITSADKISQGTGVPRGTVERILKYLENEVMIEEQTTKKFRLISVINYNDYNSDEEVNEEQVRNKRGTSEEQVDTTKNDKELNRIKKNDKNLVTNVTSENISQGIQEVMKLFYEINPSLNFGNTTFRKSAEWLIKKYSLEGTLSMARQIIDIQGQPYSPRATNPYQMKLKLADFKIYFDSERNKSNKIIEISE